MSSRSGDALESQSGKLLNERYGRDYIVRKNELNKEKFEEILDKGVLEIDKENRGFPDAEKEQDIVDEIKFLEGYQYEHLEFEDFYIFTGEFKNESFIGVSTDLSHQETSDHYTRLYFSNSIPDRDIGHILEENRPEN